MMRAKCSGAKRGIPLNSRSASLDSVSPMRSVPRSITPITSPGHASSTAVRSRARNCCGDARRIGLPVRTCFTCIPASNRPEQMRTNATRSRCFGSMFAWILNTKPVNCSVGRLDEPGRRLARRRRAARARGTRAGTARRRSSSARCRRTPATARRRAPPRRLNGCPASSSSAMSCTSRSCASAPSSSRSAGSSSEPTCTSARARAVILAALEAGGSSLRRRSYTPTNAPSRWIGQVIGWQCDPEVRFDVARRA